MAAIPINFPMIVSFIATIFFLLGVHHFITNVEENGCEMTFMFEYPQFVEVGLPEEVRRKHPRYSLYAYGEGDKTGELRNKYFYGIPVLFIPGNSGSHRQGRSLASVALRKAFSGRTMAQFDFFLADFGEDLSGIYGGVLEDQTDFVIDCIERVLSLYSRQRNRPTSVILIGHSAGGVVAKGIFTNPHFDSSKVRIVLTLATPHKAPVARSDFYFVEYYRKVSAVWSARRGNVSDVTFVSLGGGERDILVQPYLLKDPDADVNVLTSHVPGVWCSTDHLSITWCKQLILAVVRALFDCVDIRTRQITTDRQLRQNIFSYHLVKRSAGKKYERHIDRHTFESNGRWIENLQRQFSVVEKNGLKVPYFLMLRLYNDPKHEIAVLETVNLNYKDWVYACVADVVKEDYRACDTGVNLSNLTDIMPAQSLRRKLVRLNLRTYRKAGFTHIVAKIPHTSSPFIQLNVDIYQASDRVIRHPVPRFTDFFSAVVIETTADNALYYRVILTGFESGWQAYHFYLQVLSCKAPDGQDSLALASLVIPWANETKHFRSRDKQDVSGVLRLMAPRPNNTMAYPELHLKLDPSCKYKLHLGPDRIAAASQIIRYYWPHLVTYLFAALVLTIRAQLKSVDEGKGVPFFHNALTESTRRYYIIIQTVTLGSKLIGGKMLGPYLPTPDMELLHEERLDFLVLPLILYAVANGLLYIIGALVYGGIVLGGQTANKCAFRFLGKVVTGFLFTSWTEWLMSGLHQLPFIVSGLLISLSVATCGGLAMSLAAGFYILKLFNLYDDYLQDLFKMSLGYVARKIKSVVRGRTATEESNSEEEIPANAEEANSEDEEQSENVIEEQILEVDDGSNDEQIVEVKDGSNVDAKEEVEDEGSVEVKEEQSVEVRSDEGEVSNEVEEGEVEEGETDVVEVEEEVREISTLEQIHFHVTLCLLYLVTAATTVPSILGWSRSFHESTKLLKDPAWLPGIVLCGAGAVLWQGTIPNPLRKASFITNWFLFCVASLSITYGSVSLYRLPYFSCVAVSYVVLHQFLAKFVSK